MRLRPQDHSKSNTEDSASFTRRESCPQLSHPITDMSMQHRGEPRDQVLVAGTGRNQTLSSVDYISGTMMQSTAAGGLYHGDNSDGADTLQMHQTRGS